MKYSIDFILRYTEGRLDEADRSMLERDAAADPAVQAAIDEIALTRQGLQVSRADSFKPFFSERVLRKLRPAESPEVSLYLSLRWAFVRAGAVAAIAAIVLAGLNVGGYGELDVAASFVDAAFGIPDASPLEAWTYTGMNSGLPSP
jgi:anti-sigma factor RsiW